MERFACPSPDRQGRYRCIDDHVLCDGFIDCPEGEDEERQACMFYKTVSLIYFDFLVLPAKTGIRTGSAPMFPPPLLPSSCGRKFCLKFQKTSKKFHHLQIVSLIHRINISRKENAYSLGKSVLHSANE